MFLGGTERSQWHKKNHQISSEVTYTDIGSVFIHMTTFVLLLEAFLRFSVMLVKVFPEESHVNVIILKKKVK